MNKPGTGDERGTFATRLALTSVAVALAAAHLIWPHVSIDAITIALLLVAVLPWLYKLFSSITTPFFTVEYREIRRQLDAATSTAESTHQLVRANESRHLAQQTQDSSDVDATLAQLAQKYDDIRSSMPSGAARTDRMTGVVGKMIAAIEAGATVDVDKNLHSHDRGERLVAYAALYSRPEPAEASALVDCLIDLEDAPFGEYWALQSLRRLVEAGGGLEALGQDTYEKLRAQAGKSRWGRDRQYELERILRLLEPDMN